MIKRGTKTLSLLGSLLPILFLAAGLTAHGQDSTGSNFPVSLSCVPDFSENQSVKQGNSPFFAPGQVIVFTCIAKNTSKDQAYPAMLLGRQTDDQGSAPVVSSNNLAVGAGAETTAKLQFPALFRSGTYRYSFTLFDSETKQAIAEEMTFIEKLGGDEQAHITATTTDKDRYDWAAPFELKVALALPQGKSLDSDPLSFEITMQNKQGNTCAILAASQPATSVEDTYRLTFPKEGVCSSNAITIALKSAKGSVVDQKVIAVGLPETKASESSQKGTLLAKTPRVVLIGLGLTGILFLIIAGYFFIRRSKKNQTPTLPNKI